MEISTPRIVIAGTVSYEGTISKGTGFNPECLHEGYFRVNFTTPLKSPPVVVVTVNTENDNWWTGTTTLHNVQATSFDVTIRDIGPNYCSIGFCFAVLSFD